MTKPGTQRMGHLLSRDTIDNPNRIGIQHPLESLATGLVDENAMMEIFVSPSGTWTILATGTDGVSCVLAVGEGFEANTQIAGLGV